MKYLKIFIPVILILLTLASCGPANQNDGSLKEGSVVFVSRPVQSEALLATPILKFIPGEQQLDLNLGLKNLAPETINISLVMIHNENGMTTFAEGLPDKNVGVDTGKDTTLLLTFNPINEKSLFQNTGLHGLIDSVYTMSVYYTIEGKEGTRVVGLESRMPKDVFFAYRKSHDIPIRIYYFNTSSDFDQRQQQNIKTNTPLHTSSFVHTTEQELAVSGLNFRIKCFHRKDSLFAEIFTVNHSDMTIRMDTSKMDLLIDDQRNKLSETRLSIEKVVGSKDEADILRTGDRSIIKMRSLMHNAPEKLLLAFAESFYLSNDKPLFCDDLELSPFSRETRVE
jgi:hypothetical protein